MTRQAPERPRGVLAHEGLVGLLPPIAHMRGKGLGVASIAATSGGFFFVFTTIAIVMTALFSFILAAEGLWSSRRGGRRLDER